PRSKALKAPRRAPSQQLAQDQRQVEAGPVAQQPFEDVLVSSKMRPPHPAGVIAMGEAPFDQLAALAHQPPAAPAANPPPVGIHRVPLGRLALPVPSPAIRLGDVGPLAGVMASLEHFVR